MRACVLSWFFACVLRRCRVSGRVGAPWGTRGGGGELGEYNFDFWIWLPDAYVNVDVNVSGDFE